MNYKAFIMEFELKNNKNNKINIKIVQFAIIFEGLYSSIIMKFFNK